MKEKIYNYLKGELPTINNEELEEMTDELYAIIEEEEAEEYNAGYRDGQSEGYDRGYEDGCAVVEKVREINEKIYNTCFH